MKTYADKNPPANGAVGFEIDNVYIGVGRVAKILRQIPGVTSVQQRKPFTKWTHVHIWFKYQGYDCLVIEPFGDSSRYWLGPKNVDDVFSFTEVERAFKMYRPSTVRRIIGDLISLNFSFLNSKPND